MFRSFSIAICVLCEVMATGGDHERLRVTVLTGEANWASWKVQMRHQLRSRKLWNIVRGEERIAAGAEQGEKTAFEERCIEATMRLTFAMSPAVVLLVQNLDCPVKIWGRLERQYEKRTASWKLSLVQQYFGAKMAEVESAEKHLLGMNELCDQLAAMELPVPEEFQPLMILGVLLSDDMKWTPHITKITKKASSTLGFLRRNLRHCSGKL